MVLTKSIYVNFNMILRSTAVETILFLFVTLGIVAYSITPLSSSVRIIHLIDNANWGEIDGSALQGKFECAFDALKSCELLSSDCKGGLIDCLHSKLSPESIKLSQEIVVSMYHIHSWGVLTKWPHGPNNCIIPAHYSIAESEESHGRFHKLFDTSFRYYDAFSTTNPKSTIPRTYFRGLNSSDFLSAKPFHELIRGASFVASTCHRGEGTTKRMAVVRQLQSQFRVDSLGQCHTTRNIPEGISLAHSSNAHEQLKLKQSAISNYMFYCAFENTYEPGYVTEKVFDALIAGVVPIYLGPSSDCRPLLPHPRAAIFMDDFDQNLNHLVTYLQYLISNESAYEEHRAWRKTFDPSKASPLFTKSWPCRVCEWAVTKAAQESASQLQKRDKLMKHNLNLLSQYNNTSGNGKENSGTSC